MLKIKGRIYSVLNMLVPNPVIDRQNYSVQLKPLHQHQHQYQHQQQQRYFWNTLFHKTFGVWQQKTNRNKYKSN